MRLRSLANLMSLGWALAASAALANDTVASINLGGLELSPAAWVTLDSEDLYVSEKQVRVRYQFTNTASRDEHLLISSPSRCRPRKSLMNNSSLVPIRNGTSCSSRRWSMASLRR